MTGGLRKGLVYSANSGLMSRAFLSEALDSERMEWPRRDSMSSRAFLATEPPSFAMLRL